MNRPLRVLVVVLAAGCSGAPESNGTGPAPAKDADRAVREAMASVFDVKPSSVDMNRPLGDPPFNADELDLVELVMEVEERLGVEIPDAKIEELEAGQPKKAPVRVTPAQLVEIARQAKPASKSKKR